MMEKLADSSSRKTRRDFARTTSKENSVCGCHGHRSAGSRIVTLRRRTVCRKRRDSARQKAKKNSVGGGHGRGCVGWRIVTWRGRPLCRKRGPPARHCLVCHKRA